jgi:ABC-type nitrate/sulfonate/bicarbonate transport system substrate-binding protein
MTTTFTQGKLRRRTAAACVAAAAVVAVAAGCSSSGSSSGGSSTGLQDVTIGVLNGSAVLAPVYAAQGQGFFTKYDVNVKVVSNSSFSTPVAGLDAGSIDIDVVGDIYQQHEAGVHVVGVVGEADSAKDLNMICNSSVSAQTGTVKQKLEALQGKKIAFSGVDSPPYYLLLGAFKRYGLNINSVTIVNVAVGATQFATLEDGQADCTIGDMNAVAYLTPGNGRYVAFNFGANGVLNPLVSSQIVPWDALPGWADSHKTAVEDFEKAWIATIEWMQQPKNFAADETYVTDALGSKTAAPTGVKLTTETNAVLSTVRYLWGTAGAKESYEADTAAGILANPIANFDPAEFVAPGSPSTAAEANQLVSG